MPEHVASTRAFSPSGGKGVMLSRGLSLLELLHPDGTATRSLVLGNRCPTMLLPASRVESRYADLIILAPTVTECRTRGWLQKAAQVVSQKLDANGIAYVLAPLRWKLQISKLLSNHGLSLDQAIVHLPDQGSSRYLVPLSPIPARYAFSELLPLPRWARLLTTIGFRFFGYDQLWGYILPSIGMVIRHPGARPLFEWLLRLRPEVQRLGGVIIRTSWRGQNGPVILYRFVNRDDSPSAVAKMNLTTKTPDSLVGEAEILNRLGPSARSAGAQIPQCLSLEQVNKRPVLVQTMIRGQSVALLLTPHPSRLLEVLDRVIGWLESWNRSTAVSRPLDRAFLEQELLNSADLLVPRLEKGDAYRDWLRHSCLMVTGTPTTLVATHNDLTMWNILQDEQGNLGVIDWESASEEGLPFLDFFYAVTDAITVVHTHGKRSKAFRECFAVGGAYEQVMGQFLSRLRRVVQVTDEIVGLCFHACWLRHAANEYSATGPSVPHPFLEVVQWLALNRSRVSKWVHG